MAYPVTYSFSYSYTGFQQAQGDNSFPGTQLDIDLNGFEAAILSIETFIETAFRSDGVLNLTAIPATIELASYVVDAQAAAVAADASADSADADAIATAADRVQTALDRVQTGLDRVQTALDRVATAADVVTAGTLATITGGFKFTWSTDTGATDPTAGKIKVNNAAPASATALYISETDALGNAIAAEIATWDDSTNTIKARVKIQKNATNFLLLDVTTALTDNGAWDTFVVSGGLLVGALANTDTVYVTVGRVANKGADGAGAGDVIGPASAVVGNLPTYSNVSGKQVNDSGVLLSSLAPKESPALTGTPTAPTAAAGNNSTQLATTAYADAVAAAIRNGVSAAYDTLAEVATWIGTTGTAALKNTGTSGNTVPLLDGINGWSGQQGFVESTITYSATPGFNGNANQVAKITLTGNPTFAAPTNIVEGNSYQLTLIQDGTGSRIPAWNAAYKGMTGFTATTTAAGVDVLTFRGGASNTLQLKGYRNAVGA